MSDKKTIWSVIAGILSSVFAFLGIVSCCGACLFFAGVLAALGIGASITKFFLEYKGLFIAFAIVSLIYGFYQAYFKKGKVAVLHLTQRKSKKEIRFYPKYFCGSVQ